MDTHLSRVWFELTDLQVTHGAGAVITTVDGTDYLDLTSGIGVVNTGHCHPRVVEAIREQAGRFVHAQVNCYRHDLLEPLAQRLAETTPPGIEQFFFANSGAEATEAAVKLAKQATGRPNVVVFQGSFHGRTHLTMAMTTSKAVYRAGHAPLPSGVFVAPFPVTFLTGEDEDAAVDHCLREFDLLLATQTAPTETAAVMIEPVLGEGGYVPAPGRFLHGLSERCAEHGILFVADEVQTGWGRTGDHLWGIEAHGVEPDLMTFAKGLGNGLTIAGVVARAELMDGLAANSISTFGGNPLSCAGALANLRYLLANDLQGNAAKVGGHLRRELEDRRGRWPSVGEVRGKGLMLGIEMVLPGTRRPDPSAASQVLEATREQGVLVGKGGLHGNVLRIAPPLTITTDEADEGVAALDAALSEVGAT